LDNTYQLRYGGILYTMPWKKIYQPTKTETSEFKRAFARRAKFLIDEDLLGTLAGALKRRGWNVRSLEELGLKGRSDEEILAAAFREDRILLTHDTDFLKERRFPRHRNPGLVVLPGGSGNIEAFVEALRVLLLLVGAYREVFRGAYIQISAEGVLSVTSLDKTGARQTSRYRFTPGEDAEEWVEE
jgi:predicted nuclease of predicted toxin-antitoxin system